MDPEQPTEDDVVKPGRAIDLRLVAETIDVDVATLRTLGADLYCAGYLCNLADVALRHDHYDEAHRPIWNFKKRQNLGGDLR